MPLTTKNQTGSLRYQKILPNGVIITPSISLWITHLQQDNQLVGPTAQSRNTRHFYPRSYGPGDLIIQGIAPDQHSYQELAAFIRGHQEYLLTNLKPTISSGNDKYISKYQGLLNLNIPSEQIYYFGWVGTFMLQKRGVFEPAPKWDFNFIIARDENSENVAISHAIKKQFTGGDITVQKIIDIWKPPQLLP